MSVAIKGFLIGLFLGAPFGFLLCACIVDGEESDMARHRSSNNNREAT